MQELFRLEKRGPFARLFEMLLVDRGGIFEATFVMHVVRPFASSPSAEIVAAPRVCGPLWEHLVLNELRAAPMAIECKWSQDAFDPAGMVAFRQRYPAGENILVASDERRPGKRRIRGLDVRVVGLAQLGGLVA